MHVVQGSSVFTVDSVSASRLYELGSTFSIAPTGIDGVRQAIHNRALLQAGSSPRPFSHGLRQVSCVRLTTPSRLEPVQRASMQLLGSSFALLLPIDAEGSSRSEAPVTSLRCPTLRGRMTRIRRIEIRNFRSVPALDWAPSNGVSCHIGPGDSGKSTILDAIDLFLCARRSVASVTLTSRR